MVVVCPFPQYIQGLQLQVCSPVLHTTEELKGVSRFVGMLKQVP